MSNIEKRTISVSAEQSEFIDAKVASGDYASASEVVRAGLRALQQHDAAIERWLREEVAPAYDAWKKDPSRARPINEAFDEILNRHSPRSRSKS